MFNSLVDAIGSGCINFVDTAINFRYQKSERVIKASLQYLSEIHKIKRDEIFISSKGGILHEDADIGQTLDGTLKYLIERKIITDEDVYQLSCIEPKFLEYQIQQSKFNLGVERIDCYSLNLPEIWLTKLSKPDFYNRLMVRLIESI